MYTQVRIRTSVYKEVEKKLRKNKNRKGEDNLTNFISNAIVEKLAREDE